MPSGSPGTVELARPVSVPVAEMVANVALPGLPVLVPCQFPTWVRLASAQPCSTLPASAAGTVNRASAVYRCALNAARPYTAHRNARSPADQYWMAIRPSAASTDGVCSGAFALTPNRSTPALFQAIVAPECQANRAIWLP
jgi:hypothetical protein